THPDRMGNEDAHHVPSNAYPCAGEDRWVALSVQDDTQWEALTRLMIQDGVAVDADLASEPVRQVRRDEVNTLVADWARDRDGFALMERLQAQGIACGPVMNNRDLLLDPHLKDRRFYERVRMPDPIGVRPIMS